MKEKREKLEQIPEEIRAPFEQHQDIYKFLAARMLGKLPTNVTKEERQMMKSCLWLFFTMKGPEILTNLIQGDIIE